MAGKGRRTAARQSELSRRRKRTQRGPSGIPTGEARAQQGPGGNSPTLAVEGATAVAVPQGDMQATPERVAESDPRPAPQPRTQNRIRGDSMSAYNYVGSEVRRILSLATVALAALVGLSFVF